MNLSEISRKVGFTGPSQGAVEDPPGGFVQPLGPRKAILSWTAMSRPPLRRLNSKMARTLTIVGWFCGFLLLLMQEYFLILVVVAFVIIIRALRQTPPEKVKYEVSNHGLSFDDYKYSWAEFESYYLKEIDKMNLLVAVTQSALPGRVYVSYLKKDEKQLVDIFGQYLTFLEEEPTSFLDDVYSRLENKLDLEA
jgi:hypothetical protein